MNPNTQSPVWHPNMPVEDPEALVEQRIAQLETISERRNTLLREMYQLLKKRENVGTVLSYDDEEQGDLHVFLNRFNLKTNPDGYFSSLPENELFAMVPAEPASTSASRTSPVGNSKSRANSRASTGTATKEESVPSPLHSIESDDELDLIGPSATVSSFNSPPPTRPGQIEIANISREEQNIEVGRPQNVAEVIEVLSEHGTPQAPSPKPAGGEPVSPFASVDVASHAPAISTDKAAEPTNGYTRRTNLVDYDMDVDEEAVNEDVDEDIVRETGTFSPREPAEDGIKNLISPAVDVTAMDASEHLNSPQETAVLLQSYAERRTTLPLRPLDLFTTAVDTSEPIIEHPPPPPVFIPTPTSSYHTWNNVEFPPDPPSEEKPEEPVTTSILRYNVENNYTLPPIKPLPAEFHLNKKGKTKQKRKEREKMEKAGGQMPKEEWTPWGFNRWIITIKTNPVYKRVSKSTKCLTTRDWSVAMNELKLLRTAERVEYLKAKGRWSFRQPKKQRGVGGSTKTHWDYLLEEMKWMRTDFREERKWKLALAYNLSTAVLEWHAAGSLEERVKRGICVLWKPPHRNNDSNNDVVDIEMGSEIPQDEDENTGSQPSPEKSIVDYGSDDEDDDEQEKDRQSVVDDGLDDATQLEEALILQEAERTSGDAKDLEPKTEEVDDPHALEDSQMAVDGTQASEQFQATQQASVTFAENTALKATSTDPLLASKSQSIEPTNAPSKTQKRNLYAPFREQVAYSDLDQLFLDLDDFHIATSESQESQLPPIPPPSDILDIFPDIQPYGLLDVAPSTIPEGKKKSDKKSDQDPNRRIDDTEKTKLMPASKFMYTKPTLISALDPVHHYKDGQWTFDDQPLVHFDYEGPPQRPYGEEFNKLFEYKPGPIQIYTPSIPGSSIPPGAQSPTKDKMKEKQPLVHLWTAIDDNLLKSLIEKYPNNWDLVAECFNATRKAVLTDVRTSRDCQERYLQLVDENREGADGIMPGASAGVATRGVKRLASVSISSTGGPIIGSEPKRRRRHLVIQESIRKTVTKRKDAQQKANVKKPPVVHDTHLSFAKMPKHSPAELSRMKVEQELRQTQEMQLRTRMSQQGRQAGQLSQPGLHPQSQPQQPQQPQQAQQPQQQQQPQPQQQSSPPPPAPQPNGVARPPSTAPTVPNQNGAVRSQPQQAQVPISRQQRAATPLAPSQARITPQQQPGQQQPHQQPVQHQQARPQQVQAGQPQQMILTQQQQLQQQQALASALLQVQAQQAQHAAANGGATSAAPAINGTHLPAAYSALTTASRDATSSPAAAHTSPPSRTSATPVAPASQGQVPMRYYLNLQPNNYTQEQLQMLMLQMYSAQQHQQQQQQQQQQANGQQQQNPGFNSNPQAQQ